MSLVINSGYKSLNLYFTEPSNTYYIDDITTSGTTQTAVTSPRSDIDKLYIWIGTTSNFTANNNTNLFYSGSFQSNIIIDGLEDNTTYYVKYAITSLLDPDEDPIQRVASQTAQSETTQADKQGLKPWIVKTSNYTAEDGDRIIADTTNGTFTITLPSNPLEGTSVIVTDGGNFTLIPLLIARNGSLIFSQASNLNLDVLNTTYEFFYVGGTKGWDFTSTTGPKGDDGIPAELLKLEVNGFGFIFETSNSLESVSASEIVITANKQNIQGNVAFIAKGYSSADVELGTITLTGTGDTRVLTSTNFNTISGVNSLDIKYVKITGTIEDLSDTVTIYRIDNGSDSVVHILSNESHIVSADSSGTVVSYSGASTKGEVWRGSVNETMNWAFAKVDGTGLTTSLTTPVKISTTGTIGSITGTGPWTAVITNLTTTNGLIVGDTISAVENSTGRLYGGVPTSVVVTAKTGTSITYTVTGGTTPVAGPIGGLAKGSNYYTCTVTNLTQQTNNVITTITATKDSQSLDKVFSISKSKDGSGTTVIDLSNDSINIATDSAGLNGDYSLATSVVSLNVGSINALPLVTSFTITPSTGVSFSYTKNGTTVANLSTATTVSISPTISTISVAITNLNNVNNGKLTIVATYNNVQYTAEFTATKSRGGSGGEPAIVYSIEADSEVVYNPNTAIFSPSTVTYTAYSKTGNNTKVAYQNSAGSIRLEYSTNNTAWTTIGSDQALSSSVSSRTLTTSSLPSTAKFIRASFLISGSVVDTEKDTINQDGTNSSVITVDVENDSHVVPFDAANSTGNYLYSGTKIHVYDNITELQYTVKTDINTLTAGEWTFTATSSLGIATPVVKPSVVAGQKYAQVADHSSMTTETATITYTIAACSTKGVLVTNLIGNQTFSKTQRTAVFRIIGANPITRNKSGVYSSVAVQGQKVEGTTVTNPFGVLTQQQLPGGLESSKSSTQTIQPTSGSSITSVLVKLYADSSSTTVLDSVELKVVQDGLDSSIVTIDVANDTHDIPCQSDGTPIAYDYTGTIIQVFENTTELEYVATNATLANGQWKITSVTGSGITPGSLPTTATSGQKYVTIPNHSNITTESASIQYIVQAKTASGTTVSGIIANQTFSKVRRTAIFTLTNTTAIRVSNSGIVSQAVINAQKVSGETITSPFGWITEQLDSGSQTARVQLTSSGYTTTATSTTQQSTIRLFETQSSTQVLDIAQLKVVKDGLDAKVVTVDVENDSHDIPFSASNIGTYTLSGTKIQVFENTTELQYVTSTPQNGQWTITATTATGITSSINSAASNKPAQVVNQKWISVPDHSAMVSDTASITYTIQAKTSDGTVVNNLLGNQTFAKIQRTGVWKIVGAAPITVTSGGTVNNLTLSGQLVDGLTVLTSQGWLTQQVMPGGSESGRVQSITTSATSSSTHVIIKLYDAASGGNLVDQAELRVVTSGTSGQSVDVIFTRIAAGSTPTTTSTANPPTGNTTWSTSPPLGSNPLWASTGYSSSPYTSWTWDTPVRISGETVVELSIFIRSNASSVSTPTGGSYNFSTKALTPPTNWSDYVTAGTDPVWESRAIITDINTTPTWSSPVRISMSARGLDISGIVSVRYDPNSSTKFNPNSLSLTAVISNLIGNVSYSWSVSPSTGITLTNSTAATVSIAFANTADTTAKTITLNATDSIGTLTKTLILPVVESAPDTIAIDYTNDSHSVPVSGTTANWSGSGGQITVYEGQAVLTLSTISASYPTTPGRYNLAITKVSGDTILRGAISGTTNLTLGSWSGTLTQPTIYRITAWVTTSGGANLTVSTDATLTPVNNAMAYWLATSSSTLAKNVNVTPNTLTPSSLTFNIYRSIGNATPALYAGRITVEATTNGTSWTTISSGTSDTSTLNISSISPTYTALRARAYLAGGLTTLIDEEIITVINSGTNGAPGVAAKGVDINRDGGAFKKQTGVVPYSPSSISLTAAPQNLTNPTYSWSVSGGATLSSSTGATVTLTPTTATTVITVTLTATDSSGSYSKSISFGVYVDGVGTDGKRTATGYVYYQLASSSAPTKPTATQYQFSTGTFTTLSSNWSTSAPTYQPNQTYWAATYTAIENTSGTNSSSGTNLTFGNAATTVAFTGLVTVTSLGSGGTTTIDGGRITTGLISADRLDTRGLVIKDSSGNPIFGSGTPVAWSNISTTGVPTSISNSGITIDGSGVLTGIGTGNNTTVANSSITISNGAIAGIGTGNNTTVANSSITINSTTGALTGIGTTGNDAVVSNSKVSISAATGKLVLNTGISATDIPLSGAGISSMAYIAKLTSSNRATYMDSGIITNAFIGKIISSADFNGTFNEDTGAITGSGTIGWAIGKGSTGNSGLAVLNNAIIRGKITAGTTTNTKVELGKDIGPQTGYHGLSLSETNYDNVFLRRESDNTIFFKIGNVGGISGLSFDSSSNTLNIKGNIICNSITADRLITTGMVSNNSISNSFISTRSFGFSAASYGQDMNEVTVTVSGLPAGESARVIAICNGSIYPQSRGGVTWTNGIYYKTSPSNTLNYVNEAALTVNDYGVPVSVSGAVYLANGTHTFYLQGRLPDGGSKPATGMTTIIVLVVNR